MRTPSLLPFALVLAALCSAAAVRAQAPLPFALEDAAGDTLVQVSPDGLLTPRLGRLGTSDATPVEIHVDGQRVMRFEPGAAPNVIGGYFDNFVEAGVIGATISGGGGDNTSENRVLADYGTAGGGINNWVSGLYATISGGQVNRASGLSATVGGGNNNTTSSTGATVAGGLSNMASGTSATVGGGLINTASGATSTVGGGSSNTASAIAATVGGGLSNTASGSHATVGGGQSNTASSSNATVAGGEFNTASGELSFAAGQRAKAIHHGAFVWADNQNSDFTSAGINTFNVRAAGGFRFHHGAVGSTTWPVRIHNPNTTFVAGMRVTNDGFFDVTNHAPASTGFARLSSGGTWSAVSDRRMKTDIVPAEGLLAGVMQLQPARFRYRDDGSGEVHLGLIAQEVQAVFPEFVTEGEVLTLNYAGLSAVALGAIQEQQAEIARQQADIDLLKAELAALRTLVASRP